jgi:hypothetical protein
MSGVFYIGPGEQFDADKLRAYPQTAIGPLGLEYISARDDPRNHNPWEDLSDFRDGAQNDLRI